MANVTPKPRIIRIAPIRFTGIDLRTECKRRKYHSGIILGGVTNELSNIRMNNRINGINKEGD